MTFALCCYSQTVCGLSATSLTGWYADRNGTEWITFASLFLALPWWIITIIRSHLALFIIAFAIES
jgi:DHA1 family solute carrier family 18 vesicular amine transporter 1/2